MKSIYDEIQVNEDLYLKINIDFEEKNEYAQVVVRWSNKQVRRKIPTYYYETETEIIAFAEGYVFCLVQEIVYHISNNTEEKILIKK